MSVYVTLWQNVFWIKCLMVSIQRPHTACLEWLLLKCRCVHVMCISFACNKVACLPACLLALTHSLGFYMPSGTKSLYTYTISPPAGWESWIRNPRKLCFRNLEFSGALESEIQLKESGIPLTIESRTQLSLTKAGIQYLESEIHGRGIQYPRLSCIPLHGAKQTFIHLCSGPLSLLPTKRCQRPPMIHHPPRPLLLLISAVHLGMLLLHPQTCPFYRRCL